MRLSRIYTTQALHSGAAVVLEDDVAHYIGKVLRMRPGEQVALFNARDGEHLAQLTQVDKRTVTVQLLERREPHADPRLRVHLGLGLSRGERMDYAVQKATEAGVTSITPLLTERCEVKIKSDRVDNRLNHLERIAISACEQSGRCAVPEVLAPVTLQEWLAQERQGARFVLDHRGAAGMSAATTPTDVTLLIGPEGGLSDAEVQAACASGFQSVRLGPRVLRTETAPVIAIALAQYLWGDLQG